MTGFAYEILKAKCKMAQAAVKLGDLASLSFSDYKTYIAKLDRVVVDYPEEFAVKALLFVAHHLLTARTLSYRTAIEMFSLHHFDEATQGTRYPFQALAPRMRDIMPLSAESVQKALVQGLFGSVLLSYMAQPGCAHEAYSVADALRISCREAAGRSTAASEAHISGGQSAIACPCPSWITDMQDAGTAIMVLYSGCNKNLGTFTLGDKVALHRVRQASTGSLLLLARSIKKKPRATMARVLYDQSELAIRLDITDSLRGCALHPAVWARAASRIPEWKVDLPPGRTQQLEEKLWIVLLKAWESLDKDDAAGCCSLLEHLRLARCLTAPSRPTDAKLEAMQVFAPKPQLILSSQASLPLQTLLQQPSHTCVCTPSCALLGSRRSKPPTMRSCRAS